MDENFRISSLDTENVWHPFTQMQASGQFPVIRSASGASLFTADGREIIDGISSWWVNLHGHCHPLISERIAKQAATLDQVMFAGFTHGPAAELAARLRDHLPESHKRVFFSDNGSTAVEVGIKMALQYWHNLGEPRHRIIAFENAYHGDTFGAMSASGAGAFTRPFAELLFRVERVPAPMATNRDEALARFSAEVGRGDVAAFVFEPLLQGAAGMLLHEGKALDEMLEICARHGVIAIADEVFTGFGRTGKFLAVDYLRNRPEVICLSKGLSGGVLPLAATSCSGRIYDAFLSDDRMKMFFHGHSFTANPIACSAALASLDLLEDPECWERIAAIADAQRNFREHVRAHPRVRNARSIGTLLALDIAGEEVTGYFNSLRDRLYRHFLECGVLLRPLGNVVYALPPYCTTPEQMRRIHTAIVSALEEL